MLQRVMERQKSQRKISGEGQEAILVVPQVSMTPLIAVSKSYDDLVQGYIRESSNGRVIVFAVAIKLRVNEGVITLFASH